jgi:citrate lyase subunit beta / citryl-CoA lyase
MSNQSRPFRPRRSVLYMPGANVRAMEKARELACDTIIFDLEDAVAPDAKDAARAQVSAAVRSGGYGHRELVLRVNGLGTPWTSADLSLASELTLDGVLLPKVESPEQVRAYEQAVLGESVAAPPLWIMIETPRGVLGLERILTECPRVEVVVMGTSDLVKELRARHSDDRHALLPSLAHCVLVSRAYERTVLDGVHLDFRNTETFERACQQGRDLGFDGKTLIHPSQVAIVNAVFGPSAADVASARAIVAAWTEAQRAGKGVAVVDGRLVENLHAAEAERVLAFAAALADRG